MSATTFTQFPELPKELRAMIYFRAIAVQVQDLVDSLPRWFGSEWAERRRQAFVGHDNLPPSKTRLPLKVRIRDPYDGRKMRLEEDDFETLVNCLPISAVSREARAEAAEFCRSLASHVRFECDTSKLWSLKPPQDGADPVLLRDVHCIFEAETLEHVFAQPTTLTVDGGRGQFKSPEHLVDMVNRFFGNKIERLILELWIDSCDPPERPYWANSVEAPVNIEPTFDDDAEANPFIIYLTPDRKLHAVEKTWQDGGWALIELARHLLKFYEILEVSVETLPRLEHVDLNLRIQGWEEQWTRIKSTYRYGVLTVDIREVEIP